MFFHPNTPCTNHFACAVSRPKEPFAIEPEAAALRILGAEIVARRRVRAPPPGRGDALRPLDGGDVVQDAPPAEA